MVRCDCVFDIKTWKNTCVISWVEVKITIVTAATNIVVCLRSLRDYMIWSRVLRIYFFDVVVRKKKHVKNDSFFHAVKQQAASAHMNHLRQFFIKHLQHFALLKY